MLCNPQSLHHQSPIYGNTFGLKYGGINAPNIPSSDETGTQITVNKTHNANNQPINECKRTGTWKQPCLPFLTIIIKARSAQRPRQMTLHDFAIKRCTQPI
jgi:hypothetical protein